MDNDRPQSPYFGPDRRRGGERRARPDRREDIRWEPDKDDRRGGVDRRKARVADDDVWNLNRGR